MSEERKFIIHIDDYMGAVPQMFSEVAEDVVDIVKCLMDIDSYSDDEEFAEEHGISYPLKDEDILKEFENMNGDGMPFFTIFDIEQDKVIVGKE